MRQKFSSRADNSYKMPVSAKAVRERFGFGEGIAPSLRQAFARATDSLASATKSDSDTIEISLGRKRRSEAAGKEASGEGNTKSSGLRGLLGELQHFAAQLEDLETRAADALPGSEQSAAFTKELEQQRVAYRQMMQSPIFTRLDEIMKHVDRMFSQGVPSEAVARALSRERGLLGDDLLGAIQSGDRNGLSGIRDIMAGIRGVDVGSGNASGQLKDLTNKLFSALAGQSYQEKLPVKPLLAVKEQPLAAPSLQRVDMGLPGDLSFALISITGNDVAKAIESHSLPDPHHALVLVLDNDRKKETSLENKKREQEEEERRQRSEAVSGAAVRGDLPSGRFASSLNNGS